LTVERAGVILATEPQSADFITKVIKLIEQGQTDEAVALICSVEDKEESLTALRILVAAVISIITHARDRAHDLARALDLDRERALDLDLDLARAAARDHDLERADLDPERALASDLALTKAMAHATGHVADLAGSLDSESGIDLDLDLVRTHVNVILRVLAYKGHHPTNADG
jgi:hypothetical protein